MDKKIGRNDPCWCGSGKKYKQCHMQEDQSKEGQKTFTPSGKRKFKAKVLNLGGKSQSVFKQMTTTPPEQESSKFEKTTSDYRVEAEETKKPSLSKKKKEGEKPTPSEPSPPAGDEFKPTTKDWQKKHE